MKIVNERTTVLLKPTVSSFCSLCSTLLHHHFSRSVLLLHTCIERNKNVHSYIRTRSLKRFSFSQLRSFVLGVIISIMYLYICLISLFVIFVEGVINGVPAEKNQFPFAIRILRQNDYNEQKMHCSGVIIDKLWVLTAAHCLDTIPIDKLQVAAGDYNRCENESDKQIRNIQRSLTHPLRNRKTKAYDLALLRLDTPLDIGNNVRPIKLPDKPVKGLMQFAGWGSLIFSNTSAFPNTLQVANLSIVDREACANVYDLSEENTDNLLCTKSEYNTTAVPCFADSGGGGYCQNGDYVLCGILSFNYECNSSSPTVFVDIGISNISDWIYTTMRNIDQQNDQKSEPGHSSNILFIFSIAVGVCLAVLGILFAIFCFFRGTKIRIADIEQAEPILKPINPNWRKLQTAVLAVRAFKSYEKMQF